VIYNDIPSYSKSV